MKGVDISHYQKGLTIRQVKDAGSEFAIIKLTEGDWREDAAAFDFYREAYEIGFPVGCYCYSHAATVEAAANEADYLIGKLNGFPMPCGVFLDMEDPKQLELSNKEILDIAETWCDVIRAAGYTPGIYGSEYTLWTKLAPQMPETDALIWIAHYGRVPELPCDLWQASDSGHIGGYEGAIDIDETRSARFEALVRQGFKDVSHIDGPEGPVMLPDAAVAVLQLLMHCDGCWKTIDGVKSPAFFKKLREYVDRLEAGTYE